MESRSAIGDAGDLTQSLPEVFYKDNEEYLLRKQRARSDIEAAKIDIEYAESSVRDGLHPCLINRYVNRARSYFVCLDVDGVEMISARIRALLRYGIYVFHENEMHALDCVEGDTDILKQDTPDLMGRVNSFFKAMMNTSEMYCMEG